MSGQAGRHAQQEGPALGLRVTQASGLSRSTGTDLKETIEQFLHASHEPALCEPGEEAIAITTGNFLLESRHGSLTLQAWDERRNLVRRITGVEEQTRGKLVLKIERFGKRLGTLTLVDMGKPAGEKLTRKSTRLEFREVFRRFLRRHYSGYKLAELTTEADLEHSLSPAYPRALLKQGSSAWAAIGASPDPFHSDGVLTFGLIWLDYLRRREPSLTIHGLVLYLPAGHEKTTCLRLAFLDACAAHYAAFVYTEDGIEEQIDLRDYGNLDTWLEPCRRPLPSDLDPWIEKLGAIPGVEKIDRANGEISLRVHGFEFARTAGEDLLFGLHRRTPASSANIREVELLATELARLRSPDAQDRMNPLFLRNPEAWLESQVRNNIEAIDASLLPHPVYGQVPAFAAMDRGVLDLLAVDQSGRLAVIELKASEDVHLPLQALDYWMRVKWHLDREEFSAHGYFPALPLRSEPPRLLLVSPALQFHPTNERVLRFISPRIDIERIGVGLEWQWELKVMFRS